jgi:aspartate aminotransferase
LAAAIDYNARVFENLARLDEDPILGLMARYRADDSTDKVDLGVGVYRTALGDTPVLEAVRRAEREVLAEQRSKAYVAPAGRAEFNSAVALRVLGPDHPALRERRARTVQAPGGCGALRVGAELIRVAAPGATVHVSDPTWGNHIPLLGGSGLSLARYPYYDATAHALRAEAMLQYLDALPPGDVVLLHACCHNPTGADLSAAQWTAVIDVLRRRRLVPFLDLAYQGFARDLDSDADAIRRVAQALPEMLLAVSFSKNLGLYRERVGALTVIGADVARADAVHSQVLQIARSIYSMPPDHGAAIAARIFADPGLTASWTAELAGMRSRLKEMRALLAGALRSSVGSATGIGSGTGSATGSGDFDFLTAQSGMFSLLGVSPAAVRRLREEHHIYMTADGRMNVAGITPRNVGYLAAAITAVLKLGI